MATRKGPTMIARSRRVSPAEKAAAHQVTGAGRSHVLRQFFGISARDEEALVRKVDQQLERIIREGR